MNILVVEDDNEYIAIISEIIKKEAAESSIVICENKKDALNKISEDYFDLILLDFSIPTEQDKIDESPAHGYAVFTSARSMAPGTPIIVLTGSSGDDYFTDILDQSEKSDVWGGGLEIQLVSFHQKHRLETFKAKLKPYLINIKALNDIELLKNDVHLSIEEDRILRIFSRSVSGVLCNLTKINGGLSGSKVFRVIVTAENGATIHDSIGKIGSINSIRDEDQRYERYILRLNPEATPRKLALLEHGAKNQAGIFYGLANGYTLNAFSNEILLDNCENLVSCLKNLTARWCVDQQGRRSIRDIRRHTLSDEKAEAIFTKFNLEWAQDFESRTIQVHWGVSHGDLHGFNVLTSENGTPTIIDYGDTSDGPNSLDPMTLEFSLFFHPDGPLCNSTWPSAEQAKKWYDLEFYLVECPYPEFIKYCRNWAKDLAVGNREISAVSYAYLIRQLGYSDVNQERGLELLDGAKSYYSET